MKFEILKTSEKIYAYYLNNDEFSLYFGTKHLNLEALEKNLGRKVIFPKQCHGTSVLNIDTASTPTQPCDGLNIKIKEIAIGVYTADCIPLLIYDPINKQAAAIHAGWRGVATNIATQAFKKMATDNSNLKIFLGPSISKDSFEVGWDVAREITATIENGDSLSYPHKDPKKKYVDLRGVLVQQMLQAGCFEKNILALSIDTMTSSDHFSFRREGKTGRLLSCIGLN